MIRIKFIKIKNNKFRLIIIILLALIIVAIIIINPTRKEVSFNLKDRCGPIMNMISHSIGDEDACHSKCRAQCQVKDLKFSRVEFNINLQGCNNCTCFCK